MNTQGPWAPLTDRSSITVDKGGLQVRESQQLYLSAVLVSDGGFISPLPVVPLRHFGFYNGKATKAPAMILSNRIGATAYKIVLFITYCGICHWYLLKIRNCS